MNRSLVVAIAAIFALALFWTTAAIAAPVDVPGDQVTASEPDGGYGDGSDEGEVTAPEPDGGDGDGSDDGEVTTQGSDGGSGDGDGSVTEAQSGDDVEQDDVRSAGDDRDCADFGSHQEAQQYFENQGGDEQNNVDNLDSDSDGLACEDTFPTGGIDTGGGGMATPPDSGASTGPAPYVLGGAVLGLLLALFGTSLRRRVTS